MYQFPEPLSTLHKTHLDATARLTTIVLTGAEHLLEAHFHAAKTTFADGVRQARALASAKDIEEFAQLRNNFAQPELAKATGYVGKMCDIAIATQSEIGRLFEDQLSELNRHLVSGLDRMTKSAAQLAEVPFAGAELSAAGPTGAGKKKTH